jgi:hypothetical protein
MRKVLRKIVEILDGTPAEYGKQNRWSGQSVVELSLVTPILIVLLMGLAEIGWFTNNFLILLEVTRVGARFGTTLPSDASPLVWNNDASRPPNTGFNDTPTNTNGTTLVAYFRNCDAVVSEANREVQGFYNVIACLMMGQMDPLVFDNTNSIDDIVISAFSLMAVDPTTLPTTPFYGTGQTPRNLMNNADTSLNTLNGTIGNNKQVVVVGRYPTNANECTVDFANNNKVWERDPFDYFQNAQRDFQLKDIAQPANDEDNRNYVELAGYDAASYSPYSDPSPAPASRERTRGWSFAGQHGISEVSDNSSPTGIKRCYGSEWSIKEIENLMNVPSFSLLNPQRQRLPNQGMVMVEMFWKHELLLKNPVFNPVFTILGNNTTISVWAAFPLPVTEPRIFFR